MDVIPISPETVIRVTDLGYTYPDGTRALSEVNLLVRRGETAVSYTHLTLPTIYSV